MKKTQKEKMQIVVLDRGFVYVGMVKLSPDWVYIKQARNIRVWGTSKGLGELVNGPTSETKLDLTGNVQAPMRALIALIDVNEDRWRIAEVENKLDRI